MNDRPRKPTKQPPPIPDVEPEGDPIKKPYDPEPDPSHIPRQDPPYPGDPEVEPKRL